CINHDQTLTWLAIKYDGPRGRFNNVQKSNTVLFSVDKNQNILFLHRSLYYIPCFLRDNYRGVSCMVTLSSLHVERSCWLTHRYVVYYPEVNRDACRYGFARNNISNRRNSTRMIPPD